MKLFLFLWGCVSDKHKIVSCSISLFMFMSAFALVPVPMTTGNVTGARWLYNIYDEVKEDIKRVDIASRDRDVQSLIETRADSLIQSYRFQMILLELRVERTDPGDIKALDKLDKRIDRLFDKIDIDGIDRYEIRSVTNKLYLVDR